MKKIIIILISLVSCFSVYGEAHYKGNLGLSAYMGFGDTYWESLDCDGKVGYGIFTEQGVNIEYGYPNNSLFFGVGIGIDYIFIGKGYSEYETSYYKTNQSVTATPLYITLKYVHDFSKVSSIFKVNGGLYRWWNKHYRIIGDDGNPYKVSVNKNVEYPNNYMIGFDIGVRFPIGSRCGLNLLFNYTYMGANTEWVDNVRNHKTGIILSVDF